MDLYLNLAISRSNFYQIVIGEIQHILLISQVVDERCINTTVYYGNRQHHCNNINNLISNSYLTYHLHNILTYLLPSYYFTLKQSYRQRP